MKKLLGLLLLAVMMFACISCNKNINEPNTPDNDKQTNDTTDQVPSPLPNDPSSEKSVFSDYDDIINTMLSLAKYGGREKFEAASLSLDERETEIYNNISQLTEDKISYTVCDISGDGIDELIFVDQDSRSPVMLFTQKSDTRFFWIGFGGQMRATTSVPLIKTA